MKNRSSGPVFWSVILLGSLFTHATRAADVGVQELEPVQPSLESACRYSVTRLVEQDLALMDVEVRPRLLLIKDVVAEGETGELDQGARIVSNYLFQNNFRVTVLQSPHESADDLTRVSLPRDSVWVMGVERLADRRNLKLRVEGEAGLSLVVPYVDKPWVDEFAKWCESRPDQLAFHGESSLQGGELEARRGALSDAVGQLEAALLEQVEIRSPWNLKKVRVRLEKELSNPIITNKYIADWHLGESRKPYGSVYRGHVLLQVAEEEFRAWGARIRSWMASFTKRLFFGIGLMILALPAGFLTYLKLDAATEGCFTNWLRLMTVGGLGLTGFLLYLYVV